MVKRLLSALEYPNANSVNINDENLFRKLIVWLEQNKIKYAQPNTFNNLKNISSGNWTNFYNVYKEEIGCPIFSSRLEEVQWLLGLAVQIETNRNRDIYLKHSVDTLYNNKSTNAPSVVAENPLDKLDFRGTEFAEGIKSVAKILKITPHPDPLVTLKAIRKVINKRLNPRVVENPRDFIITGTPFPLQEVEWGINLNDKVLNQAAMTLRLLYINDLRDLQTRANELIVAVQNLTANPKTDTRIGKVGR